MSGAERKNLIELTVNPCKMCMPMGAVSAFYGIKGCMSILHGSQGCATYIRRHMATHYNEPVDVASSSLTEQGTVFGGEANLLKGIDNLIALYHPEVVAIATTCLAETIGEDVRAIARKYREAHADAPVIIVSSSAGYGGTQHEGFLRALRAVVEQAPMDPTPNGTVNVITSMLSPADTEALKALLEGMNVSYTLLPDLSENLDGGHPARYERLPSGGTSIQAIARMGGARYTLELSPFMQDSYSRYGVPYRRLPLPVGLAATDVLMDALMELGYRPSSAQERARARLIDGMIDAHKYNAKARAVVFGEPDFVYGMSMLLAENGVAVPAVATGSRCGQLAEQLPRDMEALGLTPPVEVREDSDFEDIETMCVRNEVNLMVGSSDGRRVASKLGIALVRCAFPIHDRVGGQRTRILGYDGALSMLETTANAMLAKTEEGFREELREKYYTPLAEKAKDVHNDMERRTREHPCFTCGGGKFARIHLPVAPKCNIQCGYCVRSFDCPNESRPGVTTKVITPEEALAR
ncbi:MAG TPA: nitrogenase component 1, partial [Clostridia bacterium]|nr:nitrogenase component 1 [Clostridia bacterium]